MILTERAAIVTGAGRGIGKAIAMALAGKGCRVLITSRSEKELETVEGEIRSRGGLALPLPWTCPSQELLGG